MRLDHALGKAGVSVVKYDKRPDGSMILLLRVSQKAAWSSVLMEFLSTKQTSWSADVSKTYYYDEGTGSIRFLWRVILSGKISQAAEALGNACIRALAASVEITSMPLVGRKNYVIDVAKGKLAGAHELSTAASLISQATGR
jgi:hypothetical protein